MADKYVNWADLAAHEVAGVDYLLQSMVRPGSLTAMIAHHGGDIRPGTTEIANEVAALNGHTYYTLQGIKASNNNDLYLNSDVYDEPLVLQILGTVDYSVTITGVDLGTTLLTVVDGLDLPKASAILSAINSAGFPTFGDTLSSLSSLCNKNRRQAGVSISVSTEQIKQFFINGDTSRPARAARQFTEKFFRFVTAITGVTSTWQSGTATTAFYGLKLPKTSDSMADFEQWINGNWTRIEAIPGSLTVATPNLPTGGTFNLGDTVYHTPTQSIYVLICKDSNWGWHWRPVQAPISPWVNLPSAVLQDAVNWSVNATALDPVRVAISNDGQFHYAGVLDWIGAGGIPRNQIINVFKLLPFGLRPRVYENFYPGHTTLDASGTVLEQVQFKVPNAFNDPPQIYVQGSLSANANLKKVYFNGNTRYALGTDLYLTP